MIHWKATIHLYLYFEFQVHKKIIASIVACPKQQKANLSSIDVKRLEIFNLYLNNQYGGSIVFLPPLE
jgi:hypothetical protein